MAKDFPKLKVQAFLKPSDVDKWQKEYKRLREIVLECELEEDSNGKHHQGIH